MPAYISHTIMAREVYKRINNKYVNEEYMITFSLGGDLTKYSKCRRDSHNKLLDEFIYNMCMYMRRKNLTNDGECLGVLYGHICHYIMDTRVHPLVRKIDKCCEKNKHNHTMIELYYDNYLSKKYCDVTLDRHDNKALFKGKMNEKVCNMLNDTYKKTYDCEKISKYYRFNLWLYKKIRLLYKIFTFNFLKKISGMNSFLNRNKDIDLINEDNRVEYNNYENELNTNSLNELFNICVDDAVKYIKKVNNYLYK